MITVDEQGQIWRDGRRIGRVYPTLHGWQSLSTNGLFVSRVHRTQRAAVRDLLGDSGISPDEYRLTDPAALTKAADAAKEAGKP